MYLDVADSPALPYGWSRYAAFSLTVVNQVHQKYSIRKGIWLWLVVAFQLLYILSLLSHWICYVGMVMPIGRAAFSLLLHS